MPFRNSEKCWSMLLDFAAANTAALPSECHEQAKVLAPLFNTLVDKISRDGPWLKEVLADVLVRGCASWWVVFAHLLLQQ